MSRSWCSDYRRPPRGGKAETCESKVRRIAGWRELPGAPGAPKPKRVRLRDTSDQKIELVWMDVYQGGKKPAKSDDHLYIDNVVIARSYIGPLSK